MAKKKLDLIPHSIKTLISWYEYRKKHNNLCTTGIERLTWWKKEGIAFPSVAAAMRTWTDSQCRAFASDLGLHRPFRHRGDTLSHHGGVTITISGEEKLSKTGQEALKVLQAEALKHPSPWRAKFNTLKDDALVPDIWVAKDH